jgi:cell wall-associated NlpC family hydrolase
MVTAQQFADAAVSTRGARFQHRGRTETSQDCVGPVFVAARVCGIELAPFTDYERTPDEAVVLAATQERCDPRDWGEHMLPGRVLLLRQRPGGAARHFAVSLGGGYAVHQETRARIIDLRENLEQLHSVWLLRGVEP